MNEPTSLGAYLRRERESRGLALRTISESTKVSVALLEGLEAGDISRWPGGIFRRAFVRSYAQCVGLDPDDVVRRFERQHPPPESAVSVLEPGAPVAAAGEQPQAAGIPNRPLQMGGMPTQRTRLLGSAADLTVAAILAFGSAAAGSRLLWPVLLIAAYFAVGIVLTGTSPMVALLNHEPSANPLQPTDRAGVGQPAEPRPAAERRLQPRRTSERPRQRRGAQARAQ
jgi:hypothetical protein